MDELELDSKRVQLIAVAPLGEKLPRALDRLRTSGEGGSPLAQIIHASSPSDAVTLGQKLEGALILFQAAKEPELVGVLNIIKGLRRRMESGQLRVVLMLAMKSPPDFLIKRLQSVGITEIITEPVNERGLGLKIERLIKSLPRFKDLVRTPGSKQRDGGSANASGQSGSRRTGGARESGGSVNTSSEVKKGPPLTTSSDFWLAQGGGARRVGTRWVVRLMGPGPAEGRWVEVESSSGGAGRWRWDSLDPNEDSFHREPGQWFFRGQRPPQFQELLWWFTGPEVALEFVKPDGAILCKFKTDGLAGPLVVAADSPASLRLIPAIEATFSKKVKSKKGPATPEAELDERVSSKKSSQEESGEEDFGGKDSYGMESEESLRPFRMVAPLELRSDFWTFEEDGRVRKVGNRWSIRIIGPGRSSGRWIQIESTDPEVKFWQWTPKDPSQDPFVKDKGAWVFRGEEPIFERLRWVLVGQNPDLSFYRDEEVLGAKVRLADDKKLEISRDSKAAAMARPLIEQTLEYEAKIKGDDGHEMEATDGSDSTQGAEFEAREESRQGNGLELEDSTEAIAAKKKRSKREDVELDLRSKKKKSQQEQEQDQEQEEERVDPNTPDSRENSSGSQETEASEEKKAETASKKKLESETNEKVEEQGARKDTPSELGNAPEVQNAEAEGSANNTAEARKKAARPEPGVEAQAPGEEFQGLFAEDKAKEAKKHGIHAKHGDLATTQESDGAQVAPVPSQEEESPSPEEKADQISAALKDDPNTPPGTAEALEALKKDLPKVEERPPPQAKENPPGVNVTALAVAFYTAEIMSGDLRDPVEIAEHFCGYVAKSCGGVGISLWLTENGALSRVASAGTGDAEWEEVLLSSGALDQAGGKTLAGQLSAAPILSKGGKAIGAIVCSGKGFEAVPLDYVVALAKIATGMFLSLLNKGSRAQRKAA